MRSAEILRRPSPAGTSDVRVGQCVRLGWWRSGRGRGPRPVPGPRQPELGKDPRNDGGIFDGGDQAHAPRTGLAVLHHCTSGHRPDLSGQQQVPRLAGQDFDYLLKLLRGFKAKTASDLDGTMTMAAQPLRKEDIESLVPFMAGFRAAPP